MDPVTAFSLAAGVLQVTSMGLDVLSKCRELRKHGSLSQHQHTEDVASRLSETVEHLKASSSRTHSLSLDQDRQLLDVSNRCTETADELLNELGKLKLHQGEAWHRTFKKAIHSSFTTRKLDRLGAKLDEYQKLLNTGILARLNAQGILQSRNLANLSLEIRNLAAALEQGHRTVADLLPTLSRSCQEHVERNFVMHEQKGDIIKQWEDFKTSLFFPEMFTRQIDIVEAHHDTCHWIFSEPNKAFGQSISQWQTGSSFADWLENGNDMYWLSGKPGSGKSTLMKYLSNRFAASQGSGSMPALTKWAKGSDVLVVSFFFWALGTRDQHNYAGFLRSSLYQIADAQRYVIPTLMEKQNVSCGPLQAWTVARLEATLKHFLIHKSTSTSLCFIIDGLDEFGGDYLDNLIGIIHLLTRTSQTRVCVSSRPEQVFTYHFSRSPQLKLQDLNLHDITKTAYGELQSMLSKEFPDQEHKNERLLDSIAFEAQGIFLWAKIMIDDVKSGIRDANDFRELRNRLTRMPKTIDGMYEHMLSKLDESYADDARRYFQTLMRDPGELTLLHFIFAEDAAWYALSIEGCEYSNSREFNNACNRLEKRISTRCAGLVEVAKTRKRAIGSELERGDRFNSTTRPMKSELQAYPQESNISRHLRDVKFIHRTVAEFLSAHPISSRKLDGSLPVSLGIARGRLGVMSLLPSMTIETYGWYPSPMRAFEFAYRILEESPFVVCLKTSGQVNHIDRPEWTDLLDDIFKVLCRTKKAMSVAGVRDYESHKLLSDEWPPFDDSAGFAAFFGCDAYVSRQVMDRLKSEYLSSCAILGMEYLTGKENKRLARKIQIPIFLGIQKILQDTLHFEEINAGSCDDIVPRIGREECEWATFLRASIQLIITALSDQLIYNRDRDSTWDLKPEVSIQMVISWEALATSFLASGANINIPLYIPVLQHCGGEDGFLFIHLTVESTALAAVRSALRPEIPAVQHLIDFLRSNGAIDDYSFHSVAQWPVGKLHLLTKDQSTDTRIRLPHWRRYIELPLLCITATDTQAKDPDSATEAILSQLIGDPHGAFSAPFDEIQEDCSEYSDMTLSTTSSSHTQGS